MSDQGYIVLKNWSTDQVSKVSSRAVPIGPVALMATAKVIATAPPQQIMHVERLAVCNPTGASVSVTVSATVKGTSFAQVSAMPVAANASVDLTDLIGGLYREGSTLSASGAGLVISGWYGAIL